MATFRQRCGQGERGIWTRPQDLRHPSPEVSFCVTGSQQSTCGQFCGTNVQPGAGEGCGGRGLQGTNKTPHGWRPATQHRGNGAHGPLRGAPSPPPGSSASSLRSWHRGQSLRALACRCPQTHPLPPVLP